MPDSSPKIINSQLSLTSKPQFYVLVGVKSGVTVKVELFDQETAANAALDQLQNDYHPEADDLQIFSILLNSHS